MRTTEERIKQFKKAMPAGATLGYSGKSLEWSKRGGYAGEKMIQRALLKLQAVGFAPAGTASGGTPDGSVVTNGTTYRTPEGDELSTHSRYGVEACDNNYSIRITIKTEETK